MDKLDTAVNKPQNHEWSYWWMENSYTILIVLILINSNKNNTFGFHLETYKD